MTLRPGQQRWLAQAKKGRWFNETSSKAHYKYTRGGASLALLLSDEAVYVSGANMIWAFSIEDGALMWEECLPEYYHHLKAADLFLVDGVLCV